MSGIYQYEMKRYNYYNNDNISIWLNNPGNMDELNDSHHLSQEVCNK